jgi:CO/xanthine dehydrogenase FAD-binding subunit
LIALGARLKIVGPGGARVLSLEDFVTDFYETTLSADEIVEEIQIPFLPKGSGVTYLKHTMRVAFDLAIVGVAVRLDLNLRDGVCLDSKIVLGVWLLHQFAPKRLRGSSKGRWSMTHGLSSGQAASLEVDPIHDVRASSEYRREMTEVFVNAVRKALERAKGVEGREKGIRTKSKRRRLHARMNPQDTPRSDPDDIGLTGTKLGWGRRMGPVLSS